MNKNNCKALRNKWIEIYYFLISKEENLQHEFPDNKLNENLMQLCDLFEEISNQCMKVATEFSVKESYIKFIKRYIYEEIFNKDLRSRLNLTLKHYCKTLIIFFENQDKTSYLTLFEKIYKVLDMCFIPIENIFKEIIVDVLKDYIKNILSLYNHEYGVDLLEKILEKKTNVIEKNFFPSLFPQALKSGDIKFILPPDFYHKIYFETRIESIFEIVMEYPDSLLAIQDMKKCISVLNNGMPMCEKLKSEINQRLLHPAVATPDLITAYICIIKSLRLLDSTYIFEEIVTPDIRSYLLKREDTIKSIVDKILTIDEENDNCIYHELAQPTPIIIISPSGHTEIGDVKCTLEEMYHWNPDPIDSIGIRSLWYKPLDVLSLLLSIYNSRELFASEYKNLLSQRLLKNMNFDVDKEIRNLETLKLRFGQDYLQDCDVMLKDIRESRRINNTIQEKFSSSEVTPEFGIQSYVISAEYWSKMTDREFQLPYKLKSWFDQYCKYYSEYKRNRDLKWYHMIGTVDLEVSLGNKILKLEVSPLQATVIYCFCEKERWELSVLAQNLQLNLSVVRQAINFWIQKEFLNRVKEFGIPEAYVIVDYNENEMANDKKKVIDIDIDGDSDEDEEEASKTLMYQNLWMIIKFILTHASTQKQSMDVDKIFSILPTYTSGDPIKITKEQLEIFLDNKVTQKMLVVNHKNYYLNKSQL